MLRWIRREGSKRSWILSNRGRKGSLENSMRGCWKQDLDNVPFLIPLCVLHLL